MKVVKLFLGCAVNCLSAFTLFLSLTFTLNVNAQISTEQALRVLKKDAIFESFDQLAAQAASGFNDEATKGIPTERREKLIEISREIFNASRMQDLFAKAFAAHMNAKDAVAIERWLDSPLGKRLVQQEIVAVKKTDPAEIMRDGQFALQKASAARQQLIRDLVKSAQMVEISEEVMVRIAMGMFTGMAAAGPIPSLPMPGAKTQDAENAFQGLRLGLRSYLDSLIFLTAVSSYQSFTDKEVQQYTTFFKNPVGKAFLQAMRKSYNEMFYLISEEFGAALTKSFGQVKS
jgi:hypothetical protein